MTNRSSRTLTSVGGGAGACGGCAAGAWADACAMPASQMADASPVVNTNLVSIDSEERNRSSRARHAEPEQQQRHAGDAPRDQRELDPRHDAIDGHLKEQRCEEEHH